MNLEDLVNFMQFLKQIHIVGQELLFLDKLPYRFPERLNPTNTDLLYSAVEVWQFS